MKIKNENIFELGINFNKPGLFCVESEKRGFNEYRFYESRWIVDWPQDIYFVFDGESEEHFLLGGLHWILVSDSVKKILKSSNVQGVQLLPVEVSHKKTNKLIGPYYAINVITTINKITRNSVKNLDIFRRSTSVFISERLRNELVRAQATSGARFTQVPSSILDRDNL